MNFESKNPFNFSIPEKKSYSLLQRLIFPLIALMFFIVPLYSIDGNVFKTNEVIITIDCGHAICSDNTSCIYILY